MPSGFRDAQFEAVDHDIEEQVRDKHRWEDFVALRKFEAFQLVNASDDLGVKVLPTRFVDASGKSRFVATEFKTRTTDEYFAQATTMATSRVIDVPRDGDMYG